VFLCKLFNILYKLHFLLLGKFLLGRVLDLYRAYKTLMPSRQRGAYNTMLSSNFSIQEILSRT
jgi:hypothetical protein